MSVHSEKQRVKDRIDAQVGRLIESRSGRSQAMKDPDYLKIAFRNMSIQEILVSMDLRKMANARER
jgi:hypothetical protein